MKKIRTLLCISSLLVQSAFASPLLDKISDHSLRSFYEYYAGLSVYECDIGEHMPVLFQLAQECPRVTEIGLGQVISTWALLYGLVHNPAHDRSYVGIDIAQPSVDNLKIAALEALKYGIQFQFIRGNDLYLDIEETDFLFIDSMHTYCHLSYELDKFASKVRKYIAMHDTSAPWGNRDDAEYYGNYSEYPARYSRLKQGLWPAVCDFLERNPEWELLERRLNCHGFTILKRKS